MAQQVDYSGRIPMPPADLVEWAKKQGAFEGYDLCVFRSDFVTNPLTGEKERVAKCACTACGKSWREGWLSAGVCSRWGSGYGIVTAQGAVEDGKILVCPECGATVRLKHISGVNEHSRYNPYVFVMVFDRIDNLFAAVEYCVEQRVSKEAVKTFHIHRNCAYVFETDRRCIQLQGFTKRFTTKSFLPYWWQKQRCDSRIDDYTHYIYPCDFEQLLKGSAMENCRLDRYIAYCGKTDRVTYPVKYLKLWQKHHNIEVVMDIGLEYMVHGELRWISDSTGYTLSDAFPFVKWKEKSPYRMLGYNRQEMRIIRNAMLPWSFLKNYIDLKDSGIAFVTENINLVQKYGFYVCEALQRQKLPVIKTLKYLQKQGKPWSYLEDYWRMCRQAGLDTEHPSVLYPKKLEDRHDEIVKQIQWSVEKKNMETFSLLSQRLEQFVWESDGICIRAAASEQELIVEGKLLEHCVGGYGESHCNGKSIFFVRRSETPDKPWYTLQVDLKQGKRLQLHGYRNDRLEPVPQKVNDFVNRWLTEIFVPFDVSEIKKAVGMTA